MRLTVHTFSQEEANALLEKCTEIGRLLGGMMAKAEMFCRPSPYKIQEEQAVYFVETDPDSKPEPLSGTVISFLNTEYCILNTA